MVIKERDNNVGVGVGVGVGVLACARKDFEMQVKEVWRADDSPGGSVRLRVSAGMLAKHQVAFSVRIRSR